MASGYEVNRRLAAEAERRGDALAATVRWCLAAHSADDDLARVAALGAALRNADLALHQAVYASITQQHYDEEADEAYESPRHHSARPSWRELAQVTGIPPSTLNRRYRRPPARRAPPSIDIGRAEVERLMEADAPRRQEPGLQ